MKENIIKERKENYRKAVSEYRDSMRRATAEKGRAFPAIKTRQDFLFPEEPANASLLPTNPSEKVDMRDLDWGDREKVLRLLFAKINSVQGQVKSMPEHPLQMPPPGETFVTSQTPLGGTPYVPTPLAMTPLGTPGMGIGGPGAGAGGGL